MYTYKYPHPAVTTDSVIFGFDGASINILLIERGLEPYKGSWALPGGFLRMDETVEDGAKRELCEETNIKDVYLEQFHVFSGVNRDPRERVLTVAFFALVSKNDFKVLAGDDANKAQWHEWNHLPPLAFDHAEIISMARKKLQEKLRVSPIAFKLLDNEFKMDELQRIYELIHEKKYDRRNFMRKMEASGFLSKKNRKIIAYAILCFLMTWMKLLPNVPSMCILLTKKRLIRRVHPRNGENILLTFNNIWL